jgi:hypothetical protein
MPCFTLELSCTDGSTDASIFRPSVHPTLYKSVGAPTVRLTLLFFDRRFIRRYTKAWVLPVITVRRRLSFLTLILFARAVVHRASSPSLPPAKSREPVPPPQPSVPAAGSSRSPPAAAPLPRVQSHVHRPPRDLGFRRCRGFWPGAAVQARRRPSRGCTWVAPFATADTRCPSSRCGTDSSSPPLSLHCFTLLGKILSSEV